MSDSEAESVDAVEVSTPQKKTRPPISEERRKQMLENLAKGRKKRAENLSAQRLAKEQEDLKKQKETACDYCGSEFKYKASKTKHMKTCIKNPNNTSTQQLQEPEETPEHKPIENEVVERKEEKPLETPIEKAKKKKKKVVYKSESEDSSSEEEIVYKKRKPSKRRVVYVDEHHNPFPSPPPLQRQQAMQPAPKPQISEAQRQAIMKQRAEEKRYAEIGRKHEIQQQKIKMMSANMLRKNRF